MAEADYNQAIKLNSQYIQTYNNRGLLYFNQGELDLAKADYNQAIRLNPNFADAYFNRFALYLNQGKIDLAMQDLKQAYDLYKIQGNTAQIQKIVEFVESVQQQQK